MEKIRITKTPSGGYIVRRSSPRAACWRCGCTNTVTASGYCVACHATPSGATGGR